jgi:hypothetical protein
MNPNVIANQTLAAVTLNAQRLAIQFETSSQRFTKAVTIAYLSGAQQTAAFMTRNDGEVTSQQIEKGLQEAGHLLGFELVRPNAEHIIQAKPEEPTAPTVPKPNDGKPKGSATVELELVLNNNDSTTNDLLAIAREFATRLDSIDPPVEAYEPDAPALQAFAERNNLEDCSLHHLCQIVDDARSMENAPQDPKPSKD